MKDFFQHREHFAKKAISEEVEIIAEGLQLRKKAGNKNAWVNLHATSSGIGLSGSVSAGRKKSGQLNATYNTKRGITLSIQGTGLRWTSGKSKRLSDREKQRRKEERAAETKKRQAKREKQKLKSQKKAAKVREKERKSRLKTKEKELKILKKQKSIEKGIRDQERAVAKQQREQEKYDAGISRAEQAIVDKKLAHLEKSSNIFKDAIDKDIDKMKANFNRQVENPWSYDELSVVREQLENAISSKTLSGVKKGMSALENAFKNNWWLGKTEQRFEFKIPKSLTTAKSVKSRGSGHSFADVVQYDPKDDYDYIKAQLEAMGLEPDEYNLRMNKSTNVIGLNVSAGNRVVASISESVHSAISLLVKMAYILSTNEILQEVIDLDLNSLEDNEIVELSPTTIDRLKKISDGQTKIMEDKVKSLYPVTYKTVNSYASNLDFFEFPEEVVMICQSIYSTVVRHDRSFFDKVTGRNKNYNASEVKGNLSQVVQKLRDAGNENLAKMVAQTLDATDTESTFDLMMSSGTFDQQIDFHNKKIEGLTADLQALSKNPTPENQSNIESIRAEIDNSVKAMNSFYASFGLTRDEISNRSSSAKKKLNKVEFNIKKSETLLDKVAGMLNKIPSAIGSSISSANQSREERKQQKQREKEERLQRIESEKEEKENLIRMTQDQIAQLKKDRPSVLGSPLKRKKFNKKIEKKQEYLNDLKKWKPGKTSKPAVDTWVEHLDFFQFRKKQNER